MSKSDVFENDLLKMIFQAAAIANLADNAASAPLTSLYVALHTADPGEAGNQTTSEISYTGYARVSVLRSASGWTVTGASVSPVADISFPISTGGTGGTATFASVGVASSGASKILYSGALAPNIVVTTGVTPIITTGSTITED
jgi:hypothetical protein